MMDENIASIVVPLIFVTFGTLLIVYRRPIADWYRGRYESTFGSDEGRVGRSFTPATMTLVGTLSLAAGLIFGITNVVRLLT